MSKKLFAPLRNDRIKLKNTHNSKTIIINICLSVKLQYLFKSKGPIEINSIHLNHTNTQHTVSVPLSHVLDINAEQQECYERTLLCIYDTVSLLFYKLLTWQIHKRLESTSS